MTTVTIGKQNLTLPQVVSWLSTHLAAIVSVEFFTIPVYLTAVYSFTDQALGWVDPDAPKDAPKQPLFDMQQRLLSVAIQEMYHLQLASNLASAIGEAPDIPQLTLPPNSAIPVPHLKNVTIPRLGNVPTMIDSMIAIERPDPDHVYPQPNKDADYDSIADLYHATAELLGLVAQAALENPGANDLPPFDGGKQVSYGTFTTTYVWNTIPNKESDPITSAAKAINAITDQGEGKDVVNSTRVQALLKRILRAAPQQDVVVGNVDVEFQPASGTRFYIYGMFAHEDRFDYVLDNLKSDAFARWEKAIRDQYGVGIFNDSAPTTAGANANDVQNAIDVFWSALTNMLREGFRSGQLAPDYPQNSSFSFNDIMLAFKYALPMMWATGHAPSFKYRTIGLDELQKAFDTVDPYCIIHWDDITQKLRADPNFPQNVCQGLNTCAGRGWGGTGATQGGGDSACCTADLHTCGGGNLCKTEGACGYLSTDDKQNLLGPAAQWIPSMNACKGQGGCQTPISPLQVFSSAQKKDIEKATGADWTAQWKLALEALAGTNVWERARTLHNWSTTPPPKPPPPPHATVDYDGLKRRQQVQPSSVT
jgi:hypothetical protein